MMCAPWNEFNRLFQLMESTRFLLFIANWIPVKSFDRAKFPQLKRPFSQTHAKIPAIHIWRAVSREASLWADGWNMASEHALRKTSFPELTSLDYRNEQAQSKCDCKAHHRELGAQLVRGSINFCASSDNSDIEPWKAQYSHDRRTER